MYRKIFSGQPGLPFPTAGNPVPDGREWCSQPVGNCIPNIRGRSTPPAGNKTVFPGVLEDGTVPSQAPAISLFGSPVPFRRLNFMYPAPRTARIRMAMAM